MKHMILVMNMNKLILKGNMSLQLLLPNVFGILPVLENVLICLTLFRELVYYTDYAAPETSYPRE